jgi:hypothetical protein
MKENMWFLSFWVWLTSFSIQGLWWGRDYWEVERGRRSERVRIWSKYILWKGHNETHIKKEGGVRGKKEQHRGNIIKGHCMHVLKYHSETLHFVQLTHSNKKNRLLTWKCKYLRSIKGKITLMSFIFYCYMIQFTFKTHMYAWFTSKPTQIKFVANCWTFSVECKRRK